MSIPTPEEMAQRLDKLERQSRWWKGVAMASLLGLSSLLLMGQTSQNPEVVVARAFILKNPDDKVVAILGEGPQLAPALSFTAPHLNEALKGEYRTSSGTWGLHVFGSDGFKRASLGLSFEGTILDLFDGETESRLSLKAGKVLSSQMRFEPGATLTMYSSLKTRKEAERQNLEFREKITAKTEQERNKAEELFAKLRQPPKYTVSLGVFSNEAGLTLREEGINKVRLGNTTLVTNKDEKIQRPLSSLVFFDNNGKLKWKAP